MSSIIFPLLLSYSMLNRTTTIDNNLTSGIYKLIDYQPINYDSYEIISKSSLNKYVLNYNDLYLEYGNEDEVEVEDEVEDEDESESEVEVDIVVMVEEDIEIEV
jgi:hypothetical protein